MERNTLIFYRRSNGNQLCRESVVLNSPGNYQNQIHGSEKALTTKKLLGHSYFVLVIVTPYCASIIFDYSC